MSDTPESVREEIRRVKAMFPSLVSLHYFKTDVGLSNTFGVLERYATLLEQHAALDDGGLSVAYQVGRTDGREARDAEVAALKARVEELEAGVAAKDGWINELDDRVETTIRTVANRDARIAELTEIIDEGIDKLTTPEMQRLWMYEIVNDYEDKLVAAEARVGELEEDLKYSEREKAHCDESRQALQAALLARGEQR